MRTELTRQTRWGHDPEPIDAGQVPPGASYVREWVWVPCLTCDIQVDAALVRYLTEGVTCPECGARLIAAMGASGSEAADRVREEERRLSEELER